MDWNPTQIGPMARTIGGFALLGMGAALLWSAAKPRNENKPPAKTNSAGALMIVDKEGQPTGQCPLKHTEVKADVSGPLARVTVAQEFENSSSDKIEAIYVFPLPNKAAVDDMTMLVGDRTIKGKIKKREEARQIFEEARRQGHTASLLDQERPNIFTQSVTNIAPGMKVRIVISYVETLAYEAGTYEFTFPMVVGPRYIPRQGVADAGKITPPITPQGTRAGHDISVSVHIDAGVPIESLASKTHLVDTERPGRHRAVVKLRNQNEIPNKDFILRYDVAGRKVEDAMLMHRGERGGFFAFLLQPPERITPSEAIPKEIVFVIDTSGSQYGFPLEKSKEVVKLALDGLYPRDTFNLITFAGDTEVLFPQPVPATTENIRKAQQFLLSRQGGGGTEMMKAIRAALDPSDQRDHVRIVCFLTDGYVGNDMEIVDEVKRHPNARVFSFGIGSSVNRFLLDKMAEEGRGEVEYVMLNDDGSAAAKRFHDRMRNPMLTDITLEWDGLPVTDVYPKRHPDLFAAKPLVITGRYAAAGKGTLRVRGKMNGRDFARAIPVEFPADEPKHDVLASLWARTKIEDLMSQDWTGIQVGNPKDTVKAEITQIGLDYRLMTQFTSFVAVEESIVTTGGEPRRVEVPLEMPHGVSYDGILGKRRADAANQAMAAPSSAAFSMRGVFGGRTTAAPIPSPMPPLMLREEPKPRDRAFLAKIDAALHAALTSGNTQKVNVKIWLTDDAPAVLEQLKQLGLEATSHKDGKIVLGKIAAGKLEALALMEQVLFISRDLGNP